MSIRIDDEAGRMLLLCGDLVAQAVRNPDGSWTVPERDGRFTRGQTITALTIIERRARGAGDDDPFIRQWEEELTDTVTDAGNELEPIHRDRDARLGNEPDWYTYDLYAGEITGDDEARIDNA